MNLKIIQEILSSLYDDETKEYFILKEIAQDNNAIPTVMELLHQERLMNKELIQDMNLELSRIDTVLEDTKLANTKGAGGLTTKEFVLGEIKKFYEKYRGQVSHCFNKYNKEK